MTTSNLIQRVLPLVLSLATIGAAQAAVPSFNLGDAAAYSGYFYGSVIAPQANGYLQGIKDVEGRLAVGGDLLAGGTSIGYRAPYGTTGPSLVVKGNVNLQSGNIYGAPLDSKVDTNLTIGPTNTGYDLNIYGKGVYGGSNSSSGYHDLTKTDISTITNFKATEASLTKLSTTLSQQASNDTSVTYANSGIQLIGNGKSGVQVFNLTTNNLTNLSLTNVGIGSTVLINVAGSGEVVFGGGQDGQLEALRGNVLFNLTNATGVKISTLTWGSILANKATLSGTGHLEGTVVAQTVNSGVEIGWEPFKGYVAAPVPEPETYAMLLAGLGLVGAIARRRRSA